MVKFTDRPNFILSIDGLFYTHIFYIVHEDSLWQKILDTFWIACFRFLPISVHLRPLLYFTKKWQEFAV